MRNRAYIRTRLAVAAAGLVTGLFAALPPSASAVGETVQLTAKGSDEVPQGLPFKFKVTVANNSAQAELIGVDFEVISVDGGGDVVDFYRWEGSVPSGGESDFTNTVTTSQWFADTGTFKIIASIDGTVLDKLKFEVIKPEIRIPRFEDASAATGIVTTLPDYQCGRWAAGAAWGDVEGDGDPDLYLPRQGMAAQLFVNDGSGHFADEALARGVDNASAQGLGATFADFDNDGDADLYVTNDGANRLYQNDGTGHFVDIAAGAGVAGTEVSSSSSWGDYDGDGDLDLYVTNYGSCAGGTSPSIYHSDKLYRNESNGTFTDVTALLGTIKRGGVDVTATIGAGFQAAWTDLDGDGDLDIYLANDFFGNAPDANHMWRNDGIGDDGVTWKFTDVSVASGTAYKMNTMGIGISDYDRDGDLDLALTNIEDNRLLQNQGDGTFEDVAAFARVNRPTQRTEQKSITWGAAFFDLNLDGWEDVYFAAGSLKGNPEPQPNALFANGKNGKFLDFSAPSGTADEGVTRGVAYADYDGDGRMDMFIVNQKGTPKLLHNVTSLTKRHWLEVDPVGTTSNRDGCGAMLTLTVGANELIREIHCGSISLASGSESVAHFGLGKSEDASQLVIEWPSGTVQTIANPGLDERITVTESTI